MGSLSRPRIVKRLSILLATMLILCLMAGCGKPLDADRDNTSGYESELKLVESIEQETDNDYVIEWADDIMEQLIRKYLGRSEGDIYCSELDDITLFYIMKQEGNMALADGYKLEANGFSEVAYVEYMDLDDLQHFRNLAHLSITRAPLSDISFFRD